MVPGCERKLVQVLLPLFGIFLGATLLPPKKIFGFVTVGLSLFLVFYGSFIYDSDEVKHKKVALKTGEELFTPSGA